MADSSGVEECTFLMQLEAVGAQDHDESGIANGHDEDVAASSVSGMSKDFGQAEQEAGNRSVFAFMFHD